MLRSDIWAPYQPLAFYNAIVWDLTLKSFLILAFSQVLFYGAYNDYLILLLLQAPELLFGFNDFLVHGFFNSSITFTPTALFDTFNDILRSDYSEFFQYLISCALFYLCVILFTTFVRISVWSNGVEAFCVRFISYLFSASRELRLQLEAMYLLTFIFVIFIAMMIATFDDDQEELFEFFNGLSFYSFVAVFLYFLYKYSIHYFSFLEASEGGVRVLGMLRQFAKDAANTFALSLRFGVLMVRLNIYDFLDDAMDSYYIFVCDFDDDEYFSEIFFSVFSFMFFDSDNNDDRSFFFEDEFDFSLDLFSLYFIVWAKFSLFFIFALEEVARVSLAFFIVYLIIFEIQAVNRSYVEDTFIQSKKQA